MQLEKDDYFVIDEKPQEVTNSAGAKMQILSDFDGMVFQAKEVCGVFVAAKIIERDSFEKEKDLVVSLNASRFNLHPVTKEYAECIMKSRSVSPNNRLDDTIRELESFFAPPEDHINDFNDFEGHEDGP